jgi:hypothetical protein
LEKFTGVGCKEFDPEFFQHRRYCRIGDFASCDNRPVEAGTKPLYRASRAELGAWIERHDIGPRGVGKCERGFKRTEDNDFMPNVSQCIFERLVVRFV